MIVKVQTGVESGSGHDNDVMMANVCHDISVGH